MSAPHVMVAGAGPVGVVTALAAAQAGFAVTLFEDATEVNDAPRAATFHPSTLELVERLGVMDEFLSVGLVARYFEFWDKPSQTRVAQMDHALLADETAFPFVVQTEQHKLVHILLDRLARHPHVDLRLGHRVTAFSQDATVVTVRTTDGAGGQETVRGD